jgi:hypothetical protein
MKTTTALLLAIVLTSGSAMAADYSVGIVGLGTGIAANEPGGIGLNLYAITDKGPRLVQQLIASGQFAAPLSPVTINPKHDFVYVTYLHLNSSGGTTNPYLVGYKITPTGLVEQWESELFTGDEGLAGSITAIDNYLIESFSPGGSLFVTVLTQSGQQVVSDTGTDGDLVAGHIDQNGKFYYSCRDVVEMSGGPLGPANTVVVYDLKASGSVTPETTPIATSTDPAFVQSICYSSF